MLATRTTRRATQAGDHLILAYTGADFAEILADVKALTHRRFLPDVKGWSVPRELAMPLVQKWGFELAGTEAPRPAAPARPPGKEFVPTLDECMIELSRADGPMARRFEGSHTGLPLLDHQHAAVEYLLISRRAILADDMGVGKTIESLVAAREANAFPLLCVVPAKKKRDWQAEGSRWLYRGVRIQVIESGKTRLRPDAEVVVVNYDLLRFAGPKQLGRLLAALLARKFRGLICDEAHRLKGADTIRFRACNLLGEGPAMVLALTGTPVVNRSPDLWPLLRLIRRTNVFGTKTSFMLAFGDTSSKRKLNHLNEILRSHCYVRREKMQVLKSLPPKVRQDVVVSISNRAEYEKCVSDFRTWAKERSPGLSEMAAEAQERAKLEYLKQVAVAGKMAAIREWIKDFLEDSDRKLVVFGWHRSVVLEIAKEFGASTIMGGDSSAACDARIQRFQTDDACRLIVCNIQSGGEGITLHAASDVLFVEFGWTPKDQDQAEDRLHRHGQRDSVTAWYLIGEGTVDEAILRVIERKRAIADPATRGLSIAREVAKEVLR